MTTLLIIIHVLVCLFLIAIVLLQHGKGADAGATFGGGSSQTLFGSEGPVPLLNKITTFSAIVFMGTSVTLAYFSAHKSTGSVMSKLPAKEAAAPVKKEAPVTIPMPTQEIPAPAAKEEPKKTIEAAPVQQAAPQAAEPAQKTEQAVVPAVEQKTVAEPPAAQKQEAAKPVEQAAPAAQQQPAAPAEAEKKP